MCIGCWDSEKRAKALTKGLACDQRDLWKMTIEELKYKLSIESLQTGKKDFNVIRSAIYDHLTSQNISWIIQKNNTKTQIVVNFI